MSNERLLLLELARAIINIDDTLSDEDLGALTITQRKKIRSLVARIKGE